MRCNFEWEKDGKVLPCGKCVFCRVNRREEWCSRIVLESLDHPQSVFVTLTYSEDTVPLGPTGVRILKPEDLTKWMKRLRKSFFPRKVRFFACGEYGTKTGRPHYHAVLFGLGLEDTAQIESSWPHGFVTVSSLTPQRARYTARYVVKKIRGKCTYLDGRPPEFMRCSLRPALGLNAAQRMYQHACSRAGKPVIDFRLTISSINIRFDRYLRKKLFASVEDARNTYIDERAAIHAKETKGFTPQERIAREARFNRTEAEYEAKNEQI